MSGHWTVLIAAPSLLPAGELRFKASPNYEAKGDGNKDNVYQVTVRATGGSLDIRVTVTDVDEPGSVNINLPQPQQGLEIIATLDEPDAPATKRKFQWSRSGDQIAWTNISNATSHKHVPSSGDVGHYLRVTVTYTDVHGAGKSVSAISMNAVEGIQTQNAAPRFNILVRDDLKGGTGNEIITLEIAENSSLGSNVGNPVFAEDPDNDELVYALVEPATSDDRADFMADRRDDKGNFEIDPLTGQIMVNSNLDYEGESDDGKDGTHEVTVRATDPLWSKGLGERQY